MGGPATLQANLPSCFLLSPLLEGSWAQLSARARVLRYLWRPEGRRGFFACLRAAHTELLSCFTLHSTLSLRSLRCRCVIREA